jgi:hypothetical protein
MEHEVKSGPHILAAMRALKKIVEDPTSSKAQVLKASAMILDRAARRKAYGSPQKPKGPLVSDPDIGNLISKLEQ